MTIPVRQSKVALNAIQWFNVKADPADPSSEDLWLVADPAFRTLYPDILRRIRAAGFPNTMLEVLTTQTLQDYQRLITEIGLTPAPGYVSIGLPEDSGQDIVRGSAEWVHWFDSVRRVAEASNYFGLTSVFLAPEVSWGPNAVRTNTAVAVGAGFDSARLALQTELIAEAASVLHAEGIRGGLHNHVGTWIETEEEIEYVLANVPADILGASFDIGHLAWAGIDPRTMVERHASRILDLHVKDLDLQVAAESRRTPTPYNVASNSRLFMEPGLGDIDIEGVLSALPPTFDGWVIIEVDRASMDPDASARVSADWKNRTFAA